MNTTTTKIAGEAMTDEHATFKEFRAALCRMNDANTPVSVADRVMILSNATFLLEEYASALLASKPAARDACQIDNFSSRVCQYGTRSCVSEHTAPASPSGEDAAEQSDAPMAEHGYCQARANNEDCNCASACARWVPAPLPRASEQADEAVTLPIMRAAFRVTETEGDPDPNKQRFHMRFTFRSMEELHAADDQWRAFQDAARAKDSK